MCHTNPTTSNQPTLAARADRYARLLDHYRVGASQDQEHETGPLRFALAMVESQEPTSENYVSTLATFEDACALAGEEILDSGRLPDAVYDLDSGQRIEVHTTTPVVTRSQDQDVMVNPLEDESMSTGSGER